MKETYMIMAQADGKEAEIRYTASTKKEIEQTFARLLGARKRMQGEGLTVTEVRDGYFQCTWIADWATWTMTYWICKA